MYPCWVGVLFFGDCCVLCPCPVYVCCVSMCVSMLLRIIFCLRIWKFRLDLEIEINVVLLSISLLMLNMIVYYIQSELNEAMLFSSPVDVGLYGRTMYIFVTPFFIILPFHICFYISIIIFLLGHLKDRSGIQTRFKTRLRTVSGFSSLSCFPYMVILCHAPCGLSILWIIY